MGLVMVFSVQGVVEALTITQTSSPIESAPHGSSFDLKFNVGLKGNTVAYHPTYSNRRINADDHDGGSQNDDYTYIDSQGHEVKYIGQTNRSYRTTTGTAVSQITNGTFVVGSRPSYSDEAIQARTAATPYLVDTSGGLYDSAGEIIYIRTGDGSRADNTDPQNPVAAVPYRYTRATFSNTTGISTAATVANASALHDYNDEAIGITISGGGTLELKDRGYTFVTATKPASEADYNGTAYALKERVDIGLPSSMTLVYTGASVGKHTIEIWDATPTTDFPLVGGPGPNRPRSSKTFTIYVTPTTTTIGDGHDITPDSRRVPVEVDEPQQVSALFTFPGTTDDPENYRILYKVFRGSGKLYVGKREQQFTTPEQTLLVHQASDVWINMNGTSNEVHLSFAGEDRSTARARVVYEYRGKDLPGRNTGNTSDTTQTTQTTRGSLNIVASGSGNTREITVNAQNADGDGAHGISVLLNVTNGATLSRTSGGTPFTSTLTLPATAGDYVVTATTTADYTGDTETITITLPGNLGLALIGPQLNGSQTVQVTARNAAGTLETTPVLVSLTGAGTSRTVTVTGSQNVPIVLPTASGTLTASATGYNSDSVTLPARSTTTTTTTTTTTPTTTGPTGVADSIVIDGSRRVSGTLAQATRLRVRVLDANDRGVSEVAVTFRVLSPGRGTFAGARGSGRAIRVDTDRNGYAMVNFTPTTEGDVIVEAKAAKVTAGVTFILDVGESATTTTTTTTATTSDTPRRTIAPVVKVKAANRPPMLYVDGGGIYALVGADVQEFAPSVDNALNIAIGGNKVYWTEKTGESAGTINSANLDGSGVKELKSIMAVPMGIAVDAANSKLYWTNSRGRIQSANLDGSGIKNVLQNLPPAVLDIAVSRGNLYWTQYDGTAGKGSVGIANATGRGTPKYISTGSDSPGSLVIRGNKVYWTEKTGESAGTINSANLNGTGAIELNDIRAVPMGIAVDTARSKLYWTNSRGRVQSANLNGSKIQNVVDGLGAPGDMVVSNSITAPAATPAKSSDTTTASNKYDVNGDGSVDSKDSDALIVAVAAGITDAKYDVNGDGKVDITDVVAVTANRSGGAASAPTLLGNRKFSALEVDRLQEQIELLIATNDRSPAAMRTLVYLQQLIVMARPEKTQLLANYPNPFNPETWIPYELATDTDVKLTIYNAQGVVIRVLHLGQQFAGYYTDRERAAYWDGRNALGEQVASGIYFYQLETDDLSSLRKMVILK